MVKQNRSTPDCIKDCSFKQEKTSLLWDFVFSEAGMDSLEQQWIDEKMMTDGLIYAWMNAMNKQMDEEMMDDEMSIKNKGLSNPCFAGHALLKSIFSHLIRHLTE